MWHLFRKCFSNGVIKLSVPIEASMFSVTIMAMKKKGLEIVNVFQLQIIFHNGFFIMIIEYGCAIAQYHLSKVSWICLWAMDCQILRRILANVGHQFVGKSQIKYVLIGIGLLKAVCGLDLSCHGQCFCVALVVLTEMLTTYFNSLLSSAVPVLVKSQLAKV